MARSGRVAQYCLIGLAALVPMYAAAATLSLPEVAPIPADAGKHGRPFNSAVVDLSSYGYVESEYRMSGSTNTYRAANHWGRDGVWDVRTTNGQQDYATRLLVRRPADPKAFNGVVIVEWLNVTLGFDTDVEWAQSYEQFMRDGYAWVGVSAQTTGVNALRSWDRQRYGSLHERDNGQSYDIFTQAEQAVRANFGLMLGGAAPKVIIGAGQSQSATRLITYFNAIQPLYHAYDAFLLHDRTAGSAPLDQSPFNNRALSQSGPFPSYLRTDGVTPAIQVESETDVSLLQFSHARQPDNAYLRTWEVAGAAHGDAYSQQTLSAEVQRDLNLPPVDCGKPINSFPLHYALNAAWGALMHWVLGGTPPPSAEPIQTTVGGVIQRDAYGNALGGVRLPDIQVPVASYTAGNHSAIGSGQGFDGEFVCTLLGATEPLSSYTLDQLYNTHHSYSSDYVQAAASALSAGFMTTADYNQAVDDARSSDVGKPLVLLNEGVGFANWGQLR